MAHILGATCHQPAPPSAADPMPPKVYNPADQARRYAASEDALKAEGGKRFMLRLRGPAVENMQTIMADRECNQTEAIEHALNETAARLVAGKRKR